MEKLGIEKLKMALIAAIKLGEKIENKYADDGKISLGEALSVGAGSFGDVVKVIKAGKQIKAEYLDLDDNERDELTALIKEELDLANDRVENIVEKAVDFLISLEELIESMKK